MRLIRWTPEAADQLEEAVKDIQQDNSAAEQLPALVGLGRPGELTGTRALLTPPYVVVYRLTEEFIEIRHSGTERKTGAERSPRS
jgi:plasmid stabilization system protein ParE